MTPEEIASVKAYWDKLNNYEVIPIINNQEEIKLYKLFNKLIR